MLNNEGLKMRARGEHALPYHSRQEPSVPLARIDILYQDVNWSYRLVELCACIAFHSVDELRGKAVAEQEWPPRPEECLQRKK